MASEKWREKEAVDEEGESNKIGGAGVGIISIGECGCVAITLGFVVEFVPESDSKFGGNAVDPATVFFLRRDIRRQLAMDAQVREGGV